MSPGVLESWYYERVMWANTYMEFIFICADIVTDPLMILPTISALRMFCLFPAEVGDIAFPSRCPQLLVESGTPLLRNISGYVIDQHIFPLFILHPYIPDVTNVA